MSDMERYDAGLREAATWLVGQQNADGSIEPAEAGLACYHKVPYALSLAAETAAAARLQDWVRDNDLRETGELGARYDPLPPYDQLPATPIAWVVCAAQRTGQFDIAASGTRFLLGSRGQDGSFGSAEETAWAGLALLGVGETEAARRAGDCLVESLDDGDGPSGAAGVLLVRLCRATQDPSYLAAATSILGAAADVGDAPLDTGLAELGRAAALCFGVTGDPNFDSMATAVGDRLLEAQGGDGCWRLRGDEEPHRVVDVTAELAAVLAETVEGLAVGRRG
ncbi:MAG: hypothetical protein ACE5R4_07865 [Armatimonadota bacterium]